MKTKTLVNRNFILAAILLITTATIYSQDYTTYNQQSKDAYNQKSYQLAIDYATKSINLYPNGYAYWTRGNAYYALFKNPEAAADYEKATNYYTDNESLGKLYCYAADSFFFDGKYKNALDNYLKADNYAYSDKGYLYSHIAYSYYYIYDNEKTLSYGKLALNYTSDSLVKSAVYSKMGLAEYYSKNYDNSINYLNQAISLGKSNFSIDYKYRAYDYENKKQYVNAYNDLSKALELYVGSDSSILSDFYTYKVVYAYESGNNKQCLLDAQEAQNKSFANYTVFWYAGLANYNLKKYNEALLSYNKALKLAPIDDVTDKSILYFDKSLVYKSQLDYSSTLKNLDSSIILDKNYKRPYWNRGLIKNNKKQYSSALDDYDMAISLYKNDNDTINLVNLYKERALVSVKLKDFDRAKYDFQQSISLGSDNLSGLYEYGRFLLASKIDEQKGREILNEYIEKSKTLNNSNTAYANAVLKNSDQALAAMFKLLDYYHNDSYQYPWQLYNTSCVYAILGNTKKSLEYLDKALSAGFNDFEHLIFDRDLISLHNLPEYNTILTKYKIPKSPK